MRYFKAVTGFGDMDYTEIDESEVEMCIRAQVTGKVALTKEGSLSGGIIQRVVPDWNRIGKYNRGHRLTSEDMRAIPKNTVDDHKQFIGDATHNVERELKGLPPAQRRQEISEGVKKLSTKLK